MKNLFHILYLLLLPALLYGQMIDYTYSQSISGITNDWHLVPLSNHVIANTKNGLQDVRIFGINAQGDTLEAPYILNRASSTSEKRKVNFERLNESKNSEGYFYTFKIPDGKTLNTVQLDFKAQNFEYKVDMAGSMDQQTWFDVVENQRMLSIKNARADYSFTTLNFPNVNYKYLRILVKNEEQPSLLAARISEYVKTEGAYYIVENPVLKSTNDREKKQTIIQVNLNEIVPVNSLNIKVSNDFDFYRNMTLEFLTDSIKTAAGWEYRYKKIPRRVIHSYEAENEYFLAKPVVTDRLRITTYNQDNPPLDVSGIEVKAAVYSLTARFTEAADYQLVYGNSALGFPSYDIARFQKNIPKNLTALILGEAIKNPNIKTPEVVSPLLKNKAWLWGIMGLIILVLGWFTLRMMKNPPVE